MHCRAESHPVYSVGRSVVGVVVFVHVVAPACDGENGFELSNIDCICELHSRCMLGPLLA
jgi:hypothetical protein